MAKEPLSEQDIHDLLTRARIEPASEFKTELRGWLQIKLRQQLRKANTNGHRPIWTTSWYLYKGQNQMKKITPLVAVLSVVFLAVVVAGFGIMLASSSQDEEGSFAAAGEETATPELVESTETEEEAVSPTEEETEAPTIEVLTATPSAMPTLPSWLADIDSELDIRVQMDILIRSLHPEFYTYNEIIVDDDGVTIQEARYYNNDSFVIATEYQTADLPLPDGEEVNLLSQPVIVIDGLEGEALLTMETLQDGIERPLLGGGGGGGGGDEIELTQGPRLFPEVISYTDGSMVVWNMEGQQISILTNLTTDELLDIVRLAIQVRSGAQTVDIPEVTLEPGTFLFEYDGPSEGNPGFSYVVMGLEFVPLQPHHLPAVLFTDQHEVEGFVLYGVDVAKGEDGLSVELRVYTADSEEFVIIRQTKLAEEDSMSPPDGDEVVEVNGLPAVFNDNPECSIEVRGVNGGSPQELVCTNSWSLAWFVEDLSLELIGNNISTSEGLLIANGLQLD